MSLRSPSKITSLNCLLETFPFPLVTLQLVGKILKISKNASTYFDLIIWPLPRLTNWLFEPLIVRPIVRLTTWLFDYLTVWPLPRGVYRSLSNIYDEAHFQYYLNVKNIIDIWQHCVKSAKIRSFVWSVFSRIWGENTDQKKTRIWTLFMHCRVLNTPMSFVFWRISTSSLRCYNRIFQYLLYRNRMFWSNLKNI